MVVTVVVDVCYCHDVEKKLFVVFIIFYSNLDLSIENLPALLKTTLLPYNRNKNIVNSSVANVR